MLNEGKYIYCITDASESKRFNCAGIGDRKGEVYAIPYKNIAAVVSDSAVKKYEICRENMLAHQLVIEAVMQTYTVLPVRFSTIAEKQDNKSIDDLIREQVLQKRYDEFYDLLTELRDKRELGLKVLWKNMAAIFAEIVKENPDIDRAKKRLMRKANARINAETVALGEKVRDVLEAKKKQEGKKILSYFKNLAVDQRQNQLYGDRMILNAAFLVRTSQVADFDKMVAKLDAEQHDRWVLKYVGNIPPCNFVEIEIEWEK